MKKAIALFWLIVLIVLIFLALCVSAKAKEIPGGIVFSDGKDLVYCDFTTKQRINLTGGVEETIGNDPFTVSEDGTTLFWIKDRKLWIKLLPNGKSYTLKRTVFKPIGKDREVANGITDVIVPQSAKNIVVSRNGNNISFELEKTGDSMVPIKPGSEIDKMWFAKYKPHVAQYWPLYIAKKDVCNAVVFFKKDINGNMPSPLPAWQYCGNTNFCAPVWPFRTNPSYFGEDAYKFKNPLVFSGPEHDIEANASLMGNECIKRFSFRRDGHFAVWLTAENPDEELFAVIYQTPFGWGPIEIRGQSQAMIRNSATGKVSKNLHPGIYEIPVQLRNCEGLAWKPEPDGGLAFFSEGTVFLLDGEQIKNGIKNSGLVKHPKYSFRNLPVNNVFPIQPKTIITEIKGSKYHWISNNAFIFRDEKGILRLWDGGGELSMLLDFVPEAFFYCNPLGLKANMPMVSSGKTPDSLLQSVSGKNKLPANQNIWPSFSAFTVGSIKTGWRGSIGPIPSSPNGAITIFLETEEAKNSGQGLLLFALIDETDISKITDPSKYEFKGLNQTGFSDSKGKSLPQVLVPVKKIIVLRIGNTYAAIKPVEIDMDMSPLNKPGQDEKEIRRMEANWKKKTIEKYGSIDGIKKPKFTASSWKTNWRSMTYEWRYWPSVKNAVEVATTE
ncbi:MAG: hypothetical protein AAB352_01525 [Patescibacteria group bacterium]